MKPMHAIEVESSNSESPEKFEEKESMDNFVPGNTPRNIDYKSLRMLNTPKKSV